MLGFDLLKAMASAQRSKFDIVWALIIHNSFKLSTTENGLSFLVVLYDVNKKPPFCFSNASDSGRKHKLVNTTESNEVEVCQLLFDITFSVRHLVYNYSR